MVSYGGFRTWFVLGLLGLACGAPVEVPYGAPEIDIIRRNETIIQEAGACRLSGTVWFSYAADPYDNDCFDEVCKAVKAAIAQQLPNGEEVGLSILNLNIGGVKQFWCNYVVTFNSTTAMEASGIQDLLESKPGDFSRQLSNLNFSTDPRGWGCEKMLPMEVSGLTEPVKSFVAGTTSVAHWRVGKKKMNFDFRFGEFNARADYQNRREFWQALQIWNFQEETQQLLVGDLEGCKVEASATCHTSEKGGTCWCYLDPDPNIVWDTIRRCKSHSCTRNCSPYMRVSCGLSFPPHWNELQAVNETLSSLAVNGTKATFYDEVQVIEAGVDFECHQVVEVTVGVEYAFRMLCPLFEEPELDGGSYSLTDLRFGSGFRWEQERFSSRSDPPNPWIRLVALESSLGNKSDGWVNLTQNFSSTAMVDNYYDYGPSYYNRLEVDDRGRKYIRHQVHLSVRITREVAAGMWSPEPIKVPCLVELEEFELVVQFKPAPGALRMSDLRGEGPLQEPGGYSLVGVDGDGRLANLLMYPLSEDLWSRPGSQDYWMPAEDLEAWRLRTNRSRYERPSYRIIHSIRSVKASDSFASLRLTLVPPAGGKQTTWKVCFFPADGSHHYPQVCSADFPVRVSQAECDSEISMGQELSMGQGLKMLVWLQWLLFMVCTMK